MKRKRLKDLDPGEQVELPSPRGGMAASLIGNPSDFILIYGGTTEEYLKDSSSSVSKIRETLSDMWVYDTSTLLWSRMFINSPMPPTRDLAIMTTVKFDRLLLMYGGQIGQTLYNDVW